MHLRSTITVISFFFVLVLQASTAHAQAQVQYWCEPLRNYYPWILTCPVPWRAVNPGTALPQPNITVPSTPSGGQTSQVGQPSPPTAMTPPGYPGPGEPLYDWCAKEAKLPSSIAICSDAKLRALAIERQRVFNEVRWGLDPERDKALLDDQSSWVKSYPAACGLPSDVQPRLPIAPGVRDCMAQAGRARITFLRNYRSTSGPVATAPAPVPRQGPVLGPSFDCTTAVRPLGKLICSNPDLSEADFRFVQAYQALRQEIGEIGQRELRQEAAEFDQAVRLNCGVPENGPVAGSPQCVKSQYDAMRSKWASRLTGPAFEEANRAITQHIALQHDLLALGFLPPSVKQDGVYGAETRRAISAWQRSRNLPETGLLGNDDARTLQQQVAQFVAQQEKQEAEKQERERQLHVEEARHQAIKDLAKKVPPSDDQAILLVALGRDNSAVRRSINGALSLMEPTRRASAFVLGDPAAQKRFMDAAVRHLMQDLVASKSTPPCTGPALESADLVVLYNVPASLAPPEVISKTGDLIATHRLEVAATFSLAEWQAEEENQRRHDEELARQQQELSKSIKEELLGGTFQDWGAVSLSNRNVSKACIIALQSDAWMNILRSNLPVSFRDAVQVASIDSDSDHQLTRLLRGECLLVLAQGKSLSEVLKGLIANNRSDVAVLPMRIKQVTVEEALALAAKQNQAAREKQLESQPKAPDRILPTDKVAHPSPIAIPPPTSAENESSLPTCQSPAAHDALQNAVQENALKNLLTLKLLDLYDIREISASSGERRCSATAMLNAGETPILYRIFTRGSALDHVYVEWRVADQ